MICKRAKLTGRPTLIAGISALQLDAETLLDMLRILVKWYIGEYKVMVGFKAYLKISFYTCNLILKIIFTHEFSYWLSYRTQLLYVIREGIPIRDFI